MGTQICLPLYHAGCPHFPFQHHQQEEQTGILQLFLGLWKSIISFSNQMTWSAREVKLLLQVCFPVEQNGYAWSIKTPHLQAKVWGFLDYQWMRIHCVLLEKSYSIRICVEYVKELLLPKLQFKSKQTNKKPNRKTPTFNFGKIIESPIGGWMMWSPTQILS